MQKEYNCNPEDLICCVGPHIKKCHFEVEQDIRDMFYNKFKKLQDINNIIVYNKENKKYYMDTFEINRQLLINAGLKEENIIDSKICTVCNNNVCHSFRAEKELSGRAISLMLLK